MLKSTEFAATLILCAVLWSAGGVFRLGLFLAIPLAIVEFYLWVFKNE